LYIQLDDDSANVVDRISIRIKDGIGWGQIPLRKTQYQEGNFTLRAYNTWMYNFGVDFVFSKRIYVNRPITDTWLVNSKTTISREANKNVLQVSLLLSKVDNLFSPVALKDVEVMIYDDNHYLFKEKMQTGLDGSLNFKGILKDKMNGRRVRVQLTSLDPKDEDKIIQVPLIINRSQKIDLQFLPEGGKLVAGIKSVVGFKAIGEDGGGTYVSGSIFDSQGTKLIDFKALHNGMGSFEITPKANEVYTARLDSPDDVTEEYKLPKAEPLGTALHIINAEQAADLKITLAGLNSLPADSGFCLIATTRGNMYYSKKINIDQTELAVDKSLFPTGVVKFTLFKGMTPLNERLVFIDHHDRLNIQITPDKPRYGTRDSVNLAIAVTDKDGNPVEGNFSLAVTDASQSKADTLGNNGMLASLLINANLKGGLGYLLTGVRYIKNLSADSFKGEIESPGYYINRTDNRAWEALDNLLLTEGWTDYSWDKVISPVKQPYYKAQDNWDITGTVVSLSKQPLANSPVMILSQKLGLFSKTLTDKEGRFTFKDLLKHDTATYFVQSVKPNGKVLKLGYLNIDRPLRPFWFPPSIRYPTLPWYINSDTAAINLARRRAAWENSRPVEGAGILLKEVKIKGTKIIRGSWNPYGAGNADYVFDEQDIKRSGLTNLYDFLFQKIPYLKIPRTNITFNGIMIMPLMNGRSIALNTRAGGQTAMIEGLSMRSLDKVIGIEFAYSRKYTKGFPPVLEITTSDGVGGEGYMHESSESYHPLPVTAARKFYVPKYQIKSASEAPDFRPTVFWEPNIKTDQFGKATVSFRTSDSTSGLTAIIQGLSQNGSIGSSLFRLKP
jgi:hypothetical protein